MMHVVRISLLAIAAAGMMACSGEEKGTSGEKNDIVSSTLSSIQRDTQRGAILVRKKCSSCHDLERNIRKVGPPLKGVFGRAPKISGVPFDVWDEKALDEWLASPNKVKPRTTMAIPGIKSPEDRKAIIEYLKQI
jgi:cytochrome c